MRNVTGYLKYIHMFDLRLDVKATKVKADQGLAPILNTDVFYP